MATVIQPERVTEPLVIEAQKFRRNRHGISIRPAATALRDRRHKLRAEQGRPALPRPSRDGEAPAPPINVVLNWTADLKK